MRTTLSLDDDVAAALETLRKKRRQSFKSLVNEVLREGLRRLATPGPKRRTAFRTDTVDLGRCWAGTVDNVAEVIATAEKETFE